MANRPVCGMVLRLRSAALRVAALVWWLGTPFRAPRSGWVDALLLATLLAASLIYVGLLTPAGHPI